MYAIIDRRNWKVVAKSPVKRDLPKHLKGLVVDTNHLERLPERELTALYQHMTKQDGVPPWVFDKVRDVIEKANGKKTATTQHPTEGEGPVAVVRRIAEQMQGATRKDVIAACIAAGINENTAKTQYQRWVKSKQAQTA